MHGLTSCGKTQLFHSFYFRNLRVKLNRLSAACSGCSVFWLQRVLPAACFVCSMFWLQRVLPPACSVCSVFYLQRVLAAVCSVCNVFCMQHVLPAVCSVQCVLPTVFCLQRVLSAVCSFCLQRVLAAVCSGCSVLPAVFLSAVDTLCRECRLLVVPAVCSVRSVFCLQRVLPAVCSVCSVFCMALCFACSGYSVYRVPSTCSACRVLSIFSVLSANCPPSAERLRSAVCIQSIICRLLQVCRVFCIQYVGISLQQQVTVAITFTSTNLTGQTFEVAPLRDEVLQQYIAACTVHKLNSPYCGALLHPESIHTRKAFSR